MLDKHITKNLTAAVCPSLHEERNWKKKHKLNISLSLIVRALEKVPKTSDEDELRIFNAHHLIVSLWIPHVLTNQKLASSRLYFPIARITMIPFLGEQPCSSWTRWRLLLLPGIPEKKS